MNDLKHRKEKVEHLEEEDEEEGYAYYDAGKLNKPPRGALFASVPGAAGTSEKIPWKTITVVRGEHSHLFCALVGDPFLCAGNLLHRNGAVQVHTGRSGGLVRVLPAGTDAIHSGQLSLVHHFADLHGRTRILLRHGIDAGRRLLNLLTTGSKFATRNL